MNIINQVTTDKWTTILNDLGENKITTDDIEPSLWEELSFVDQLLKRKPTKDTAFIVWEYASNKLFDNEQFVSNLTSQTNPLID